MLADFSWLCSPTLYVPRRGSIGNSTTAGPIAFKFGVCLETSYFYTSQRWSEAARAHVHTRLQYLANGWVDCVQILCVTRDPLDKCFAHVWGRVHLHVRTCTPLFHISQTTGRIAFKFCVTGDQLDKCFTHVWGGVHLHVRTCTPLFQISQMAGRIAFKFGLWLGTH